jgi:four helix bundle protein
MALQSFEQLEVWQQAHLLALAVYSITREFPSHEKFVLVSQMRRAAVSIPANIAEGFRRFGVPDKVRFYSISQSSLEELRYYLILSRDLSYPLDYRPFVDRLDRISRMLSATIRAIRRE